VFSEFWDFKS